MFKKVFFSKNSVRMSNKGFTLIELTAVIAIIALIATIATVKYSNMLRDSQIVAAKHDLQQLKKALCGNGLDGGYMGDMSRMIGFTPAFIRVHSLMSGTNVVAVSRQSHSSYRYVWLDEAGTSIDNCEHFDAYKSYNEESCKGWNGPYIKNCGRVVNETTKEYDGNFFPNANDRRSSRDKTFRERGFFPNGEQDFRSNIANFESYGIPGEKSMGDPWGNPYVLQIPPSSAFPGLTGVELDEARFKFARFVSAGPNGILETPCFDVPSLTGLGATASDDVVMRMAGRLSNGDVSLRGDDIVLYVNRIDEYDEEF